jgi:RHS repeat-associated protein
MSFTGKEGPDPRFGMTEPLLNTSILTTPGGLSATTTLSRTTNLANPNDPFSLSSQTDTLTINGRTYTTTYSSTTKTITTITPQGRQQRTVLDANGRVIQQQHGDSFPVSFNYNGQGQLISITQGAGSEMRTLNFSYNGAGLVQTVTDALGQSNSFVFDTTGRPTAQTLPDGQISRTTYDANGNNTSTTPAGRLAHSFTYTPVDLESAYIPPDVGAGTNQTRYSYDADRELIVVTRPDGLTVTLAYDNAGRLIAQILPDSQISYTYDQTTGNLTTISTSAGSVLSFNYDGSLLTRITWTGPISGNVSHTYDNNFRITSESINGGSPMGFQYDNDNLITQAGSLIISRSAQDGLISGTMLGNITDAWVYNGFQEPVTYNAAYNGLSFYAAQYARDLLGRITQKTETISGTTNIYSYAYDLRDRLKEVKKNGITMGDYTYDSNGNRLSGPGVTNPTYDAQDRLLNSAGCSFTYQDSGELRTKTCPTGVTSYDYDALGNLRAVTLADSTAITYVIDGQNRRVGKTVNGALFEGFLYRSQLQPAAWLNADGSIRAMFVYGLHTNVPEYMNKGGTSYRLITDQVGSVRLVVDPAGSVAQRIEYDEFGNVISDSAAGFQPFGFAGGLYDRHTGLVRFGARDYDPQVGRWTNKDPSRFAGGLNLYSYAGNDPINLIDPLGLSPDCQQNCIAAWNTCNAACTLPLPDLWREVCDLIPRLGGRICRAVERNLGIDRIPEANACFAACDELERKCRQRCDSPLVCKYGIGVRRLELVASTGLRCFGPLRCPQQIESFSARGDSPKGGFRPCSAPLLSSHA